MTEPYTTYWRLRQTQLYYAQLPSDGMGVRLQCVSGSKVGEVVCLPESDLRRYYQAATREEATGVEAS